MGPLTLRTGTKLYDTALVGTDCNNGLTEELVPELSQKEKIIRAIHFGNFTDNVLYIQDRLWSANLQCSIMSLHCDTCI